MVEILSDPSGKKYKQFGKWSTGNIKLNERTLESRD